MNFREYQIKAARTARNNQDPVIRIAVAALGVAGEAGEVADIVKKYLGQGHSLPHYKTRQELGDVLWYISEMCTACGWSLAEIAAENIEKLRERYPNGFEAARSVNRAEGDD